MVLRAFLPVVVLLLSLPASAPASQKVRRSQIGAHAWQWKQIRHIPGRQVRNPLVHRLVSWKKGLGRKARLAEIEGNVAEIENIWRKPATSLTESQLGARYALFRSEKALALVEYARTPADVTEGFLNVDASRVDGEEIPGRKIFVQRWRPTVTPSGKVVLVSPGFQETGRSFYEQIAILNARGHDVVVMDHAWAGYTTNLDGSANAGGIERGFAVARDVAAGATFAKALADKEYGGDDNLILMGNSMGAGPGVLGAIVMSNHGHIELSMSGQLEGVSLHGLKPPRGVHGLLQAPFLRATPNLTNRMVRVLAQVPGLRKLKLPAAGIPVLTRDPQAQAAFAGHASREDVRVQLGAMVAADADLNRILTLARTDAGGSRFVIVHGRNDTLADQKASAELRDALTLQGTFADLLTVETKDHTLSEVPAHRRAFADAIGPLEN